MHIKGVDIPGCNESALIFQHADDTTITVTDKESIEETVSVFELYGKASGSKINKSKSEVMCIGKGFLGEKEKKNLGFQYPDSCIKVLGVYLGPNQDDCDKKNWKSKIDKIKALTCLWRQRNLTLSGRATVISSLFMSRVWYTLTVCPIPNWVVNEIKKICVDFLWSNGAHLVNYRTIIGNKEDGGLKIPDIYLKMLSLRLKFFGRYLNPECNVLWKSSLTYFLNKIYQMNIDKEIVFMSLDKKCIKCLPTFYQEMIEAWQFIKPSMSMEIGTYEIYSQPIFLNPEIPLKGNIEVWKEFILSGLVKLKDISYEVIPGFLPFQAIYDIVQEVFPDVQYDLLSRKYDVIISNIPPDWKDVINTTQMSKNDYDGIKVFLEYDNKVLELICCKTNNFYRVLLSKCFIKPNIYDFWLENCTVGESSLQIVWKQIHSHMKSPDCVDLDFKILHNRIFTNEKLYKCKLIDSELCLNCNRENESLFHLFLNCETLKGFHEYIFELLCELFVKSTVDILNLYGYKRIFMIGIIGKHKDVNVLFVNFLLSVARLCIMKTRQMKKNNVLNVNIKQFFRYTLKHYVTYFHSYCKTNNKMPIFMKHFLIDNPIVQETYDILVFTL